MGVHAAVWIGQGFWPVAGDLGDSSGGRIYLVGQARGWPDGEPVVVHGVVADLLTGGHERLEVNGAQEARLIDPAGDDEVCRHEAVALEDWRA